MTRTILTAFLALACFFYLLIYTNFLSLLPLILWKFCGILFVDVPKVVKLVVG